MPRLRPRAIPFTVLLALLCLAASSYAQVPSPSPSSTPIPPTIPTVPISLDEALRLANAQVSTFQAANLNERIAAEDLRQAQAAFLPKISAPLTYTYTSPAL